MMGVLADLMVLRTVSEADADDAATGVIGGILRDISALFNMIFFLEVFVGICLLVMVVFFGDGLQWSFTT